MCVLTYVQNVVPIETLSCAVRVEEGGQKAFGLFNAARGIQNNVVNVNYSH